MGKATTSEPGITVVVMAYDEVESLEAVTCELHEACLALGRPFEILMVDDGSTDGTGPLAERLSVRLDGVRAIRHGQNEGLGAVYRTGLRESLQELVTFYPADGEYPADLLGLFADAMEGADLVLGTLPARVAPILSRFLSWAERCLLRLLFGPMPEYHGVMMLRRRILDRMELTSEGAGWTVVMELILRADRAGCALRTVPTRNRRRMAGQSKVNTVGAAWANFVGILRLWWRMRREDPGALRR